MQFTIAIHPDDYTDPATPGKYDASSPRWAELLHAAGHNVRWVDVRRPNMLEQLQGCHGFMWRWAHFAGMGRIARRLLPVLERELGLAVYPDQNTCWHYDDKIAQAYLLKATGIPTPQTWVWFDHDEAREWAKGAAYPLVLKLAAGAGSANVRLIRDASEALRWIDRLFRCRTTSLDEHQFAPLPRRRRLKTAFCVLWRGLRPTFADNGFEAQSGYVLFQEFLRRNSYDTRVTVVGDRAFGFRRYNRDSDFRASGSGRIDYDPSGVDPAFIKLAFGVARSLETQSVAIDGLWREGEPLVGEISYTYVSQAVHDCPGHWDHSLAWHEGHMWPEDAQLQDFLVRLGTTYGS